MRGSNPRPHGCDPALSQVRRGTEDADSSGRIPPPGCSACPLQTIARVCEEWVYGKFQVCTKRVSVGRLVRLCRHDARRSPDVALGQTERGGVAPRGTCPAPTPK